MFVMQFEFLMKNSAFCGIYSRFHICAIRLNINGMHVETDAH